MGRIVFSFLIVMSAFSSCKKKTISPDDFIQSDTKGLSAGDTIVPFNYLGSGKHRWEMVIEIAHDDLNNLPAEIAGRKFIASDNILDSIKTAWKFRYTGSDIATTTSTLSVYRDGDLVDEYGLVLERESIGLQSQKYGWIEPVRRDVIMKTIMLMDRE